MIKLLLRWLSGSLKREIRTYVDHELQNMTNSITKLLENIGAQVDMRGRYHIRILDELEEYKKQKQNIDNELKHQIDSYITMGINKRVHEMTQTGDTLTYIIEQINNKQLKS